jgi:hypothetical protein
MQPSPLDFVNALSDGGANASLSEIAKSMTTMNHGTDISALTGGGSFRIENMDAVLASATVKQEHFKFLKRLLPNRRNSWSVIDQMVVKTDIGSYIGSANSDEIGASQVERQGEYRRLITKLGTYFSRRSVSIVTAIQATLQARQGVVDFSAVDEEDLNSALELSVTLEYDLFFGNQFENPLATNGLIPTVMTDAPDNVTDLWGEPLKSHAPYSELAGKICDFGSWGHPSLAFMSGKVKKDLDDNLEVGYRVNLDKDAGSVQTGVLVRGMHYSSVAAADGMLDFDPSAFLNEDMMPIAGTPAGAAMINGGGPLTVTGVAAANPLSKFTNKITGLYTWTVGGNYMYAVEAHGVGKVSLPTLTAAIAVVQGDAVTLTITPSATNDEAYYRVYRSRRDGSAAFNDFRFIGMIKKNLGGVTTFVDLNTVLPGSSYSPILTMDPGSIRWIQMLPMTKIPFALTSLAYRWGCFLVGALRTSLPKHHGVIKNIIPLTARWRPF